MKKDLPYSRVGWGIAVLRDPSPNKPDNSSFKDEIAMQGTLVSLAAETRSIATYSALVCSASPLAISIHEDKSILSLNRWAHRPIAQ